MILYLVVTCGPRPVQQVVLNEPFDSRFDVASPEPFWFNA